MVPMKTAIPEIIFALKESAKGHCFHFHQFDLGETNAK